MNEKNQLSTKIKPLLCGMRGIMQGFTLVTILLPLFSPCRYGTLSLWLCILGPTIVVVPLLLRMYQNEKQHMRGS